MISEDYEILFFCRVERLCGSWLLDPKSVRRHAFWEEVSIRGKRAWRLVVQVTCIAEFTSRF